MCIWHWCRLPLWQFSVSSPEVLCTTFESQTKIQRQWCQMLLFWTMQNNLQNHLVWHQYTCQRLLNKKKVGFLWVVGISVMSTSVSAPHFGDLLLPILSSLALIFFSFFLKCRNSFRIKNQILILTPSRFCYTIRTKRKKMSTSSFLVQKLSINDQECYF